MDKNASYIESFLRYTNPVLPEIDRAQESRPDTQPHIGIHVGTFLGWLIRVMGARRVLEFGTCLGYSTVFLAQALRDTGGVLTAVESNDTFVRDTRAGELREEHRKLQELANGLRERGIATKALLIQGRTVEKILDEAARSGAETIVIGSHGHGALHRVLLGSVSEGVVRSAACPVHVVPASRG